VALARKLQPGLADADVGATAGCPSMLHGFIPQMKISAPRIGSSQNKTGCGNSIPQPVKTETAGA
jgi:hypothetical protein